MKRPTIPDLAQAAGVSVATINRVLNGSTPVRTSTIQRVQEAAGQIGFHGLGVINARTHASLPRHRFAFLLQQSSRALYQLFAQRIREAAAQRRDRVIEPMIEFADDLAPEHIAARLRALGKSCDAVAVIAADHPLIGQAIQALRAEATPVVAYITDQSAPDRAGYVGTDNWKLGRTAAWFIAQTARGPGRVAVFIGNHRYQCQDVADASFRSYMRENSGDLVVEDSRLTHEEPREAHQIVSRLLEEKDDLVGIYIAGGGISGVLRALRESPEDRRRAVRLVCRDMGPETRKGLAEGLVTAALCHPLEQTSSQLVQTMLDALEQAGHGAILQRTIPFEIVTPESI
ncbi:LacI family transcriptional regulator [Rubellimicrobium rubrum]|uniref:LacI family transcriptional regulator n=1 Tax=Rubellimicrobium rubrum TaxID=2585369 RepID=A0A5C4MPZ1_9RHOB|nr:LacI family DNA-binding transcriptional regulator [Rubellimicrobium rubrum]TNC46480.1 LacI family transcriptional regulator [Rubellimicrobium rubrum]